MKMQTDITILGGGLAGLTLAHQLHREQPDLDVVVVEKKQTPYPQAIHKIGESTVEIGAHYLDDVLGLNQHLQQDHLRKYGLRLFFGDTKGDFSQADELGTTRELAIPTWQLDRGVLENFLVAQVRDDGNQVFEGSRLTALNLDCNRKTLDIQHQGSSRRIESRWLIDAAGRTSVLKPRLGLARKSSHRGDAVWFRVDKRINIDDWSTCSNWRSRCGNNKRWLSTNHLMGPGYWVWLIPLACGATSIGIVTDPRIHPLQSISSWPLALNWLSQHQPKLFEVIEEVQPMDFGHLRNYPHECSEVMSADRWALSGESGIFLDPFYSPGTDYIGISNTFLTDLIRRDMQGEDISQRTANYQRLFFSFYESTLLLYKDLYSGFGDASLMNLKTVWDYAYYWGVLAPVFFSRAMIDSEQIDRNIVNLAKTQKLNRQMHMRFQSRAANANRQPPQGTFIDQSAIPSLARYNSSLQHYPGQDDISDSIDANSADLHQLEKILVSFLENGKTAAACPGETELLGDFRQRLAG